MELRRASLKDADAIWRMQKEAFAALLEKYQDYEASPASEPVERVQWRLQQPQTYFYYIINGGQAVGAIRVIDRKDGSEKRISPIFILPPYRNQGYAQAAIREVERIHGEHGRNLDTILQEAGNCHLYEKLGYHKTGETTVVNERMTLAYYEKK